jgi:calcineurin-like phosphoesterase family protein
MFPMASKSRTAHHSKRCRRRGTDDAVVPFTEGMIYFTSDTHFGDPRVLRIDKRPFKTIAAHDEALIRFWNEVVQPGDEVWHLGDFARGGRARVAELLSMLHGRKHLVVGNNDGPDTVEAKAWASVQHYAEMTIEGNLLILCHFPFRTWNKMGKKSINLHGHSHGRLTRVPRQYDVGVDAQDLRPASLAAILSRGLRRAL